MNLIISMLENTVLAIKAITSKSIYNTVELNNKVKMYWTKSGSIMTNAQKSDIVLLGFDKVYFKLSQNLCSIGLYVLSLNGVAPDGWEKSAVNLFNAITDRAVMAEMEVPKLTSYKVVAEYQLEELNQSLEKGEKWLTC